MGRVEFLGRRRDVIAAFGDRQRNDSDFRPRENIQRRRDVARLDEIDMRANHARFRTRRFLLDDSGQPILLSERLAHDLSASRTPPPMIAQS